MTPPGDGAGRWARWRPHGLAVLTAAAVLVLTAVLTVATWQTNRHSDKVLLQRQVAQAAAVLSTQVAVVQTQLADAGQVADATNGSPTAFTRFAAANTGSTGASYSLWRVADGGVRQLAVQGPAPELPAGGAAFLTRVPPTGKLTVAGIVPGGSRLAYALQPAGETAGLVVYVESPLRPDRRITVPPGAAFSGLDFAVYLGDRTDPGQLVEATRPTPIPGATAVTRVPFGDTVLTVVGASPTPLTGGLSPLLPWLVIGVGVLIALGGAILVETITRRRAVAERLAETTEQLYHQQQGIAAELQHALLPALPRIDGLQAAARYRAGVDALEIGGDWFDVIEVTPGCVVFVVGDVSGRGLPAATTMAGLRFAVRAFVSEGHPIEGVLTRLRGLLDVSADHQFATVLLGELDVGSGRLRLVCAGHFPPLVVTDGQVRTLDCPIAPPVGVDTAAPPQPAIFDLPPGAVLLAFSDGLVERRGEVIDTGLARLAATAGTDSGPLEGTLDRLLDQLTDPGVTDDTVLLGLRRDGVPVAPARSEEALRSSR